MTNSRSSRLPKSSWLGWLAALGLVLGVVVGVPAEAAPRRKRIAVLAFEGPRAKTFRAAVVKLIKRRHTVIAAEVWNRAAEDLEVDRVTEKNIRRVAKKLNVDGVVTGTVERRRDDYIVRLKLKAGSTGELVGGRVDVSVRGTRLSAKAQREIREELVAAIGDLDRNAGSERGDEEIADAEDSAAAEETATTSGKRRPADVEGANTNDESAGKPSNAKQSKTADDEGDGERAKSKSANRKTDEDDSASSAVDEDAGSKERPTKSPEREGSADGRAQALTPTNRAIDVVVGASFNVRGLQFSADADLANPPLSYRQRIPVVGAMIHAVVYPAAFGHRRRGILAGLGLEVMYDRVLSIRSQRSYLDQMSNQQVANLNTAQDRLSLGGVVRYPVAKRVVLGGKFHYSKQQFVIAQRLPNDSPTDLPSVRYSMLEPKLFVMFMPASIAAVNLEGGAMFVSNSGPIADATTGYGSTSGLGFEFAAALDIHLTKSIFFRVLGRIERLSLTFNGSAGSLATSRDADPMQDVRGATDLYYGGAGLIGFAY